MTKTSLRDLFKADKMVSIFGAGSPLEILLVERAGFEAAYISGYSVAAHRFGVPDIGLIAFKEMRDMVEAVCDVVSIPIVVDCDTGYGGVLNVRQTVRAFEAAGAAAVQIEDQTWPKRCGHMSNKGVEPSEVAVRKIEAAVAARRSDDLVIIARTDSREIIGFDEAMRRCKLYKAAGADVVLMHGPQSVRELEVFAAELPEPRFVAVGEGEFTDELSLDELHELGFQVALYPSSLLRTGTFAVRRLLERVKAGENVRALAPEMVGLNDLNQIVGLDRLGAFEDRVTGETGSRAGEASLPEAAVR